MTVGEEDGSESVYHDSCFEDELGEIDYVADHFSEKDTLTLIDQTSGERTQVLRGDDQLLDRLRAMGRDPNHPPRGISREEHRARMAALLNELKSQGRARSGPSRNSSSANEDAP